MTKKPKVFQKCADIHGVKERKIKGVEKWQTISAELTDTETTV